MGEVCYEIFINFRTGNALRNHHGLANSQRSDYLEGAGGNAATIQAAIEAAANGDIVLLTEPLYTGDGNRDVDFLGKAVTVQIQQW